MKLTKAFAIGMLTLVLGSSSFAQEQVIEVPDAPTVRAPEPAQDKTLKEQAKSAVKIIAPVQNPRSGMQYLGAINFSAVEFPIPKKMGLTAGLVSSEDQTWEVEYMKGSLNVPGGFRDLGSITDTRIGIIGRSYFGNSFHLSYGVSYFDFTADVGDRLVSGVSGGVYPSMNALHIQGYGLNAGLGNIWTFRKNITLGIDWLTLHQPLYVTKRSSDFIKSSESGTSNQYVADTMKIVSYLPRFAMVQVHLGMLF